MTDLITLFSNIQSIATSLERIADTLESRSAGNNTIVVSATSDTVTVGDKAPRKRRTKAEIEAERAAELAAIQPEDIPAPAFVPPAAAPAPVDTFTQTLPGVPEVPAFVPPVAAPAPAPAPMPETFAPAPVAAAPVAAAPVAPVAAPVPAAPAIGMPLAQYATLTTEQQFSEMLSAFAGYANITLVRDALVEAAGSHGVGLPMSDPADRNSPGAAYRGLSVEARADIYGRMVSAIMQSRQAAASI